MQLSIGGVPTHAREFASTCFKHLSQICSAPRSLHNCISMVAALYGVPQASHQNLLGPTGITWCHFRGSRLLTMLTPENLSGKGTGCVCTGINGGGGGGDLLPAGPPQPAESSRIKSVESQQGQGTGAIPVWISNRPSGLWCLLSRLQHATFWRPSLCSCGVSFWRHQTFHPQV